MKPVLLLVAADAASRASMLDELASRFARDYTIRSSTSTDDALQRLEAWREDRSPVAMVLADVGSADLDGIELLSRVRGVVPTASRIGLLDPGGAQDAPALRRAVALGRIDTVLGKPVGPRDEDFFAVLTEYLADWAWISETVRPAVHIVGDSSSPSIRRMVELLGRHGVGSRVHLPESSTGSRIRSRAPEGAGLPLVQVLDRAPLIDPSLDTLAVEFGFPRTVADGQFDLTIIGAGPAGLAAAVYGGSEGLSTLVVEREAIGGQAATSSMIRNYLGFPRGITGRQLGSRGVAQATRFGAALHLMRTVIGLEPVDGRFVVSLDNGDTVTTRSVLLACGVSYRRLGVEPLEELVGAGVFYGAATSEAQALEGLEVYVVGGGNSAGQAALHLARYAARVTVVVRGPGLARSMSDYLVKEIEAHDRVAVVTRTEVVDGGGDGHLQWLALRDDHTSRRIHVPAAGLFVLIGAEPRTEWLPPSIACDERGHVRTGADIPRGRWPSDRPPMAFETSLPGVFAVGDVRAGSTKRVAAAAGEGAVVIPMVHHVLGLRPRARGVG